MYSVSTLEELTADIRRYRPSEILKACHTYALRLSAEKGGPLRVRVDEGSVARVIRVAPYSLAMVARLSLLEGSELVVGGLNDSRFRRILAKVADLYDPMDALPLLIRTGYEQGWYQEDVKRTLARAVVMYRDIPNALVAPRFGIGAEFERLAGLAVEDFLGLSFLAFAKMSMPDGANVFLTTVRPVGVSAGVTQLWTVDRLDRFLRFSSTDIRGFRAIAASNPPPQGASARYAFNPLFLRPIIDLGVAGHVAPLPDLLMWRAEWGPYWALRDAYRQDRGANPFAEFFGKEVFERYVGLLLEDAMPAAGKLPERSTIFRSGRGEGAGPDWMVIQGGIGLAIECTVGSVPVSVQTEGDVKRVEEALRDRYAQRMNKLPGKVEEVASRRPDLGLDAVERWHHVVVYKEPIPFLAALRPRLLNPHLTAAGKTVHLMSVSDFETLLAVEATLGVMPLLAEKEASPALHAVEFRSFLHHITVSRKVGGTNRLLAAVRDEFLSAMGVP